MGGDRESAGSLNVILRRETAGVTDILFLIFFYVVFDLLFRCLLIWKA